MSIKYIETVIFNSIEAKVKNLLEHGAFPLLEYQKERFIADTKDAINKDIHSAIIRYGYAKPLNNLEVESGYIERLSSRLVEYMSNLQDNKYTEQLNDLIKALVKDLSNLFCDDEI